MSINSIQSGNSSVTSGISGVQNSKSGLTDTATQISSSFSDYLNELSSLENNSDSLLQQLAAGEDVELHEIMIATTETDVSFRVAMSIRDKLVEAYKEVMRMTV
jgi:flagellar hook-basal body complex protein FliE